MKLYQTVLDLLFPPKCAFCGKVLQKKEEGVCVRCDLPEVEEQHALRKGAWGRCAVTFYYEGAVRQGIHGLKFGGRAACAAVFARFLAQTAAEQLSGEFDTVTFVPVSEKRRKRRGYDQSRLLAEEMAKIWGVETATLLKKVRHTPPQSTIQAPEERRANVLGAYEVLPGAAGRRILLVDDVITSGATMAECVRVLRAAGAESVVCAALATPRDGDKKETKEKRPRGNR